MKKLRVSSFEFQVSSSKFAEREVAAALAMAVNLKPETRNPKPAARSPQLVAAALSLAVILTAWPLHGGAQAMNDPTRPPESVVSTAPGREQQIGKPLLQSVMISRTERSAIIGGELVKLGGKYRDARLIRITETDVVLRSENGAETLRLYPGIEMKPVKPATAVVAPQAARKPAAKSTQPRGDRQ